MSLPGDQTFDQTVGQTSEVPPSGHSPVQHASPTSAHQQQRTPGQFTLGAPLTPQRGVQFGSYNPPTDATMEPPLISINASAQTPLKLTSTNYQSWHTQWYSLLIGYDFLNFVETPPSPGIPITPHWFRQDHLIRSALIASLSPELIPFVTDSRTSYDVWTTLKSTYAKNTRARKMVLQDSLRSVKKGTLSITEYMQRVKQIISQLASAGVIVSDDEMTLHVIHGLPSSYQEITGGLRARENSINFNDLHEKLLEFEIYLQSTRDSQATPVTANFASNKRGNNGNNHKQNNNGSKNGPNVSSNNRGQSGSSGSQGNSSNQKSRVICQFCDKPGHVLKQCRSFLAAFPWMKGSGSTSPGASFSSAKPSPNANFAGHTSGPPNTNWLVDSGASHHVSQDLQNMTLHSEYDGSDEIVLGDGSAYGSFAGGREN